MVAVNTNKPMYVRFPADLHAAVKERAAAEERTMAQLIRHALRYYMFGWSNIEHCCKAGAETYPDRCPWHGDDHRIVPRTVVGDEATRVAKKSMSRIRACDCDV